MATSFVVPEIVYRGMRSKKWIGDDNVTILPEAYLKREAETSGLSVGTTPQAVREFLPRIKGIAWLATTGIRAIVNMENGRHLDVILDNPTHGNIDTAIPEQVSNPDVAEVLAGELARISKLL